MVLLWFLSTDPEFLEMRQEQLQDYLSTVLVIPSAADLPTFLEFLEISEHLEAAQGHGG
jgi:hypothetical protein